MNLFGCASYSTYKAVYEDHERQFRELNEFTEHKIQRNGYYIYAREFGKRNEDNEPTIILMHGFPDSLHLYDELIPYLVNKRRHVIAFDFLGWGNSDKPLDNEYNSKSLKNDLETVVQYFNLDNVLIVTHDASGPPGIDWALENENKVSTLVLLNTYYHPMRSLKAPEAIALFSTPSVRRSLTVFVASHNDARWQDGIIEQLNKFMLNPEVRTKYTKIFAYQALDIRQAFFGLNNVLTEEIESRKATAVKKLGSFSKPVVIIFGSDDPYLNSDVAKEFDSIFPNSTLKLVENAGHYVQLDRPEVVAEYILNYR